jgi:hypothetical protein
MLIFTPKPLPVTPDVRKATKARDPTPYFVSPLLLTDTVQN